MIAPTLSASRLPHLRLGLAAALPALLLAAATARAVPVPTGALGACVRASASSVQPGASAFAARGFHLALEGGPGAPDLDAASMRLSQSRGGLDATALNEAAIAAAAALLLQAQQATHPHSAAACPAAALEAPGRKLQDALLDGGAYDFVWSGATVRAGGNGTRIGNLSMHAERHGALVEATLSLHGIAPAKPVAGMKVPSPQSLDLKVSGPADRIASTLGGGLGAGETVPFTLSSGVLALGAARFGLTGNGAVGATPQQGRFTGMLTASDFDAAIAAANEAGLVKLRTGLYLARLAARQEGDRLAWDLQWQQGVLFVNNVPLPIR